jgi:transcriptional regulator with XRE-family HTH domain
MDKFTRIFADNLRKYRMAKNLTQEELAARAGMPATMINHYECARRSPGLRNLTTLYQALGISPNKLLLPSDEKAATAPDPLEWTEQAVRERIRRRMMQDTEVRIAAAVADAVMIGICHYLPEPQASKASERCERADEWFAVFVTDSQAPDQAIAKFECADHADRWGKDNYRGRYRVEKISEPLSSAPAGEAVSVARDRIIRNGPTPDQIAAARAASAPPPSTGDRPPLTGAVPGRCFDIDGYTWHQPGERCGGCGFGMEHTPPPAPKVENWMPEPSKKPIRIYMDEKPFDVPWSVMTGAHIKGLTQRDTPYQLFRENGADQDSPILDNDRVSVQPGDRFYAIPRTNWGAPLPKCPCGTDAVVDRRGIVHCPRELCKHHRALPPTPQPTPAREGFTFPDAAVEKALAAIKAFGELPVGETPGWASSEFRSVFSTAADLRSARVTLPQQGEDAWREKCDVSAAGEHLHYVLNREPWVYLGTDGKWHSTANMSPDRIKELLYFATNDAARTALAKAPRPTT